MTFKCDFCVETITITIVFICSRIVYILVISPTLHSLSLTPPPPPTPSFNCRHERLSSPTRRYNVPTIITIVFRVLFRVRRLAGPGNPRAGGRAIRIHAADELHVRPGEHGAVFDQMVPEKPRVLSVRAERIATDPCLSRARHHRRRE